MPVKYWTTRHAESRASGPTPEQLGVFDGLERLIPERIPCERCHPGIGTAFDHTLEHRLGTGSRQRGEHVEPQRGTRAMGRGGGAIGRGEHEGLQGFAEHVAIALRK